MILPSQPCPRDSSRIHPLLCPHPFSGPLASLTGTAARESLEFGLTFHLQPFPSTIRASHCRHSPSAVQVQTRHSLTESSSGLLNGLRDTKVIPPWDLPEVIKGFGGFFVVFLPSRIFHRLLLETKVPLCSLESHILPRLSWPNLAQPGTWHLPIPLSQVEGFVRMRESSAIFTGTHFAVMVAKCWCTVMTDPSNWYHRASPVGIGKR